VFEHLRALLSSAAHYSILLIERAVVCLLRLCQLLVQHVNFVHVPDLLLTRLNADITPGSNLCRF
jgi:brefeldin A-resistance guanine nucleotide exchange factor 1